MRLSILLHIKFADIACLARSNDGERTDTGLSPFQVRVHVSAV